MLKGLFAPILLAALCGHCMAEHPTTISPGTGDKQSTVGSLAQEASPSTSTHDESPDGHDGYVSFPAAGIKLMRPAGFDNAESFHGFQQPSTHSSVMTMTIPGPFKEVTRGFSAEQLKRKGMSLVGKENVEVDGHSGLLLRVNQEAYGTEFAKWILVLGNEKETKMVLATFPRADEVALSAELKSIVLGTKLDATAANAPGADVGFTITTSDTLKPAQGIGKMLVYTLDGTIKQKSPEDPVFTAARSFSKVPIVDKRQFAIQRLLQTALTQITSITTTNPITIDGLDGYELLADAQSSRSGAPLVVYQVMLFDEGAYLLMQGRVGEPLAPEFIPEFKAMARRLSRQGK
jgi:hypothetical protein